MKSLQLRPGKYVLAVSGGVDSVTLLDLLTTKSCGSLNLVLAHFNHGIRSDSHTDEKLVKKLAGSYGLDLELSYGYLGEGCSESLAREKRYSFLRKVMEDHKAQAIITAHHQDDLLETAFLNLLRGTGWRGLTAIMSNPKVKRPLIRTPKKEIIAYAKSKNLEWREDATNNDTKYLRNYIRTHLTSKLSAQERQQLIEIIEKVAVNQDEQNDLIATISHKIIHNNKIKRASFSILPLEVRNELIAYWLRQKEVREFDRKTVERLNLVIKTASSGNIHPVKKGLWLKVEPKVAELVKTP